MGELGIAARRGDGFQNRVKFRDLLRQDMKLRAEYEQLKQKLFQKYTDNREAYTSAKGEFVYQTLQLN